MRLIRLIFILIGCEVCTPKLYQKSWAKESTLGESKKKIELSKSIMSSPLRLKDLIAFALINNPQIIALKTHWQASLNQLKIESSLPDPILNTTYYLQEIETRNGPLKANIKLSQKFPWFGKLKTKSKIAQLKANINKEKYKTLQLKIITKVKETFFELYWVNKAITITKLHLDLAKQLEKIAQIKYTAGQVSQKDLLKAQIKISQLQNHLHTFTNIKTSIKTKLNRLLGRPPNATLGKPEKIKLKKITIDLKRLYKQAKKSSPLLKLHQQQIKKARQNIKLAKLNFWPDLTLGIQYQNISPEGSMSPHKGQDAWSLSVAVNLPIWWEKRKRALKKAKIKTLSKQFAAKNTENTILQEIKNTYLRLKTHQQTLTLYKDELIPKARQTFWITTQDYKTGQTDFFNLINSLEQLLNLQLSYEQTLTSLHQDLAKLEELIGKRLNLKEIKQ
jgi:outer membrane protein TolC